MVLLKHIALAAQAVNRRARPRPGQGPAKEYQEFMPLRQLFGSQMKRRNRRHHARALYLALLAQSRRPEFYAGLAVPDTVDGRFDMLSLHMFMVLRRLREVAEQGPELAQALFDVMFQDMERSLREMGVGDYSIGKRVKQMIGAFYGRVKAYEAALGGGDLGQAIGRNIYAGAGTGEARSGALAYPALFGSVPVALVS